MSEKFALVECVGSCEAAQDAIGQRSYDVIVLDLGLPDGSGLDLMKRWRENGYNEPVLILTARDGLEDCVLGLDSGADDYLTKPFALEELAARIRSLVRRLEGTRKSIFEHRGLRLDVQGHTVHLGEDLLELTSREYALLEVFMECPGRILSRRLICERIWNSDHQADANLLDVYMSRLRSKLERSTGQSYFRTVRGVGYRLE